MSLTLGLLTHLIALCLAIAFYVLPVTKMFTALLPEISISTSDTTPLSSSPTSTLTPVPEVPRIPITDRNPDFRAKPNTNKLFLHNDYKTGYKIFEVKGDNPAFLGTDVHQETLIVNKDNTLLEGISAVDGKTRYSVPASSCSEVTDNMMVHCISGDDSKAILTIDANTGDVVSNTDSELEFHSVEDAFSFGDIEIVHVHAEQKDSGVSDFAVAVQNNQRIWQAGPFKATSCGVIYENAIFGCTGITQGGKTNSTNLYNAQTGEATILFNPGSLSSLLADGWFIYSGNSDFRLEYFHNQSSLTTSEPLIDQILPSNSNLAGNNETALSYHIEPYLQLAKNEYIVVNSEGEIKFHNNLKDLYTFYRLNENIPAFTTKPNENIATVSQNGELVLKFKSDSKQLTLLDTTNGKDLFTIPNLKREIKIVNGTLVVTPDGQDTKENKVIRIYIPIHPLGN
ncbi:hypothetical protein CFREI_10495 [Corynebacterium freiburgense]|nr:hypothetical protein CFREI_10495 [Corynebacterium freiburgense]